MSCDPRTSRPPVGYRVQRSRRHRGIEHMCAQRGATTVTKVFGAPHEQVVFCHDEATGLKAIIAIYSTALGPALGGTRFYPYGSEDEALDDVLNLAKGMAYKNALAGLDLGGGKAVIVGDPAAVK